MAQADHQSNLNNYLRYLVSEIVKVNTKVDCCANWLLEYTKKDKSLLELITSFPKCVVIPPPGPGEGGNGDDATGADGTNDRIPEVFDIPQVEVVDLEEDDSGSSYFEDEEPRDCDPDEDDKASYSGSDSESELAGPGFENHDSDNKKEIKPLVEVKSEFPVDSDETPIPVDAKPIEVKNEDADETIGQNKKAEHGKTETEPENGESSQTDPNARLLALMKPCSVKLIKLLEIVDTQPSTSTANSKPLTKKKRTTCTKIIKKKYECATCSKRFLSPSALISHNRIHTGVKPFRCSICGKRYNQKSNLDRHTKNKFAHPGQPITGKIWKCDFCTKNSRSKSQLLIHIRVHTGEKPFQCKVCGHRFSEKGNLTRHFRIHTGEKPFACDDCGKRFRRKTGLSYHRKRSC